MNTPDTDLTALDDQELDGLRRKVLAEQERRANLTAIPNQIAEMAAKYREGGGDEHLLQDALAPGQPA